MLSGTLLEASGAPPNEPPLLSSLSSSLQDSISGLLSSMSEHGEVEPVEEEASLRDATGFLVFLLNSVPVFVVDGRTNSDDDCAFREWPSISVLPPTAVTGADGLFRECAGGGIPSGEACTAVSLCLVTAQKSSNILASSHDWGAYNIVPYCISLIISL